jgi:hypothetical protein
VRPGAAHDLASLRSSAVNAYGLPERARFGVLVCGAELGRIRRDAGEPARAAPPRRFRPEDFRHEDDVGQAAEVRKGELGSFQPFYNG